MATRHHHHHLQFSILVSALARVERFPQSNVSNPLYPVSTPSEPARSFFSNSHSGCWSGCNFTNRMPFLAPSQSQVQNKINSLWCPIKISKCLLDGIACTTCWVPLFECVGVDIDVSIGCGVVLVGRLSNGLAGCLNTDCAAAALQELMTTVVQWV